MPRRGRQPGGGGRRGGRAARIRVRAHVRAGVRVRSYYRTARPAPPGSRKAAKKVAALARTVGVKEAARILDLHPQTVARLRRAIIEGRTIRPVVSPQRAQDLIQTVAQAEAVLRPARRVIFDQVGPREWRVVVPYERWTPEQTEAAEREATAILMRMGTDPFWVDGILINPARVEVPEGHRLREWRFVDLVEVLQKASDYRAAGVPPSWMQIFWDPADLSWRISVSVETPPKKDEEEEGEEE